MKGKRKLDVEEGSQLLVDEERLDDINMNTTKFNCLEIVLQLLLILQREPQQEQQVHHGDDRVGC